MVPFGSKALFGLSFAALIAAIAYGVATDDGSGGAVLGFVAAGAFALAITVAIADADLVPYVPADAPPREVPPAGARPALPSPWPIVGAIALGVGALAAATDGVVVLTAVILLTIAGIGWLFQQWAEHPTYTARYGTRIKERFLVPIGLPLGVFALVAVIAISLSRIFLALPEQGTRVVALVIALVILFSAFAIAASQRMARNALGALCAFAFLAVVGAGVAGLTHGERKFEKVNPTAQSGAVTGTPTGSPVVGPTSPTGPTGNPNGGSPDQQPAGTGGATNTNNNSGTGGAGAVPASTPSGN